jgi:hypothetical protein
MTMEAVSAWCLAVYHAQQRFQGVPALVDTAIPPLQVLLDEAERARQPSGVPAETMDVPCRLTRTALALTQQQLSHLLQRFTRSA